MKVFVVFLLVALMSVRWLIIDIYHENESNFFPFYMMLVMTNQPASRVTHFYFSLQFDYSTVDVFGLKSRRSLLYSKNPSYFSLSVFNVCINFIQYVSQFKSQQLFTIHCCSFSSTFLSFQSKSARENFLGISCVISNKKNFFSLSLSFFFPLLSNHFCY